MCAIEFFSIIPVFQNEKVKELSTKITDTRSGVTSVKSTIDGMRTTRDSQLQEMSSKLVIDACQFLHGNRRVP